MANFMLSEDQAHLAYRAKKSLECIAGLVAALPPQACLSIDKEGFMYLLSTIMADVPDPQALEPATVIARPRAEKPKRPPDNVIRLVFPTQPENRHV